MSLREEIKGLSGNRRKFLLLRIADLDTKGALKLIGITTGTYNAWCQNESFVTLYRRRDEFNADYKHEAIQLLRRDNQLEAVLLEGNILAKMKEELATGEYNLIRSQIAREVYSKLISDLDAIPLAQTFTWEQRIQQINQTFIDKTKPVEIVEGSCVEQPKLGEPLGTEDA